MCVCVGERGEMSVYSIWVQLVGVGKVGDIVSGYSGWED